MPVKRASDRRESADDNGRRGSSRRSDEDDRYAYKDDERDDDDRSRRRRSRDDDDDERDERPARRSRDRDDDDDDDRRDRRSSRRRDDDEEEDDDRGRGRSSRRSSRDDDDEEDDRRSRRSASRDDDDRDSDRRPRRDRDDDRRGVKRRDDDDRRGRDERGGGSSAVREGWGGAHKTRDQAGDFASSFKMENDKTYVVKFLDDAPYASFRQHWIDRSGKRSFVCPEDPDDPDSPRCSLCDAGDKVRAQYSFNIVVLEEDAKPTVKSWDVGIRLFQKFERIHKDDRIGPLTRPYFAVSRTGKGTNADTQLSPIKDRDLWDDYGIEELTDGEIDKLMRKRYDRSIIEVPSRRQLKELAEEFSKYDG
jgi:hypothetical protein